MAAKFKGRAKNIDRLSTTAFTVGFAKPVNGFSDRLAYLKQISLEDGVAFFVVGYKLPE